MVEEKKRNFALAFAACAIILGIGYGIILIYGQTKQPVWGQIFIVVGIMIAVLLFCVQGLINRVMADINRVFLVALMVFLLSGATCSLVIVTARNQNDVQLGLLFFVGAIVVAALIAIFHKPIEEILKDHEAYSMSCLARNSSTKSCSRCLHQVPLISRAGDRCPFCGAYWDKEIIK